MKKPSAIKIMQKLWRMWEHYQTLPCTPYPEYFNSLEIPMNYTKLAFKRYDWSGFDIDWFMRNKHMSNNIRISLIRRWLSDMLSKEEDE